MQGKEDGATRDCSEAKELHDYLTELVNLVVNFLTTITLRTGRLWHRHYEEEKADFIIRIPNRTGSALTMTARLVSGGW